MAKKPKKALKPKARAFHYALANEVTGLDFVRTIWALSLNDAKKEAERIAKCFGRSTEVVGVQLAE